MPPSPPSSANLHLDTDLALSQIGDADAMHSMLEMLQESLARDLPAIAHSLQTGDTLAANRMLHALKGFIPIFCQSALCDQVVQVEGLSKQGDGQRVAAAYLPLRVELETLLAEVRTHLVQQTG